MKRKVPSCERSQTTMSLRRLATKALTGAATFQRAVSHGPNGLIARSATGAEAASRMLARQAPRGRRFASASTNPDPAKAWSMYYTHENAYLNWVRNGATFTAVGMAFTIFKGQTEHAPVSLGGCVVQSMGACYMVLGATQYVTSSVALRNLMGISPVGWAWISLNASWPTALYLIGLSCFHGLHPRWLLGLIADNSAVLPARLQERVFQLVAEARHKEFEEKSKPRRTGTRTGV